MIEEKDGIELPPARFREYDMEDSSEMPSTNPLVRVKSRVRTQNRCFAFAITLFLVTTVVYVVRSADSSGSLVEHYEAQGGVIGIDFASPEEEARQEDFHGTNPFRDKEHSKLVKRWERTHHGQPYPGDKIARMGRCHFERYKSWLREPVTKVDGQMYTVIDKTVHDPTSFTQGLTFANGILYESTGLYGHSKVRILDPSTGETQKSINLDPKFFGEGMTYWKGKLIQITWKSQQGFVYNATTLEQIEYFQFNTTENEGWGITYDWCKDEFIVTDGSPFLHFWNPKNLKEKRKIQVKRMNGSPAKELNEIEYWRGRLLANIWYEDVLLVINTATGKVEKEYDFSTLWPKAERSRQHADVFNGISISEDEDILYVTGKKWNRMYRIRLNVNE